MKKNINRMEGKCQGVVLITILLRGKTQVCILSAGASHNEHLWGRQNYFSKFDVSIIPDLQIKYLRVVASIMPWGLLTYITL